MKRITYGLTPSCGPGKVLLAADLCLVPERFPHFAAYGGASLEEVAAGAEELEVLPVPLPHHALVMVLFRGRASRAGRRLVACRIVPESAHGAEPGLYLFPAGELQTVWGEPGRQRQYEPARVDEYKAVSKAAAESGVSTSFLAQGPTMKGIVEMQKVMVDAGIPFAQEYQMAIEGTGQAAAAIAQFGNMTMSMMVTALSTDPIPDDVLALPAGYTKK